MSVILSIKPKYVEKIKKGLKLYEFRKSIFKEKVSEICNDLGIDNIDITSDDAKYQA